MSELKTKILAIFEDETGKVNEERNIKLAQIEKDFKTLHKLSTDHVTRGSRHNSSAQVAAVSGNRDTDAAADEQLLLKFEKHSAEYENQVNEANDKKQEIREEIKQLESELRKQRDLLADKQTENRNLLYLIDRENELSHEKASKEEQALLLLHEDYAEQLRALD